MYLSVIFKKEYSVLFLSNFTGLYLFSNDFAYLHNINLDFFYCYDFRPHRMTSRSRSDHVEITFHAIASKKFAENKSNKIYLKFALEEMGGFHRLWPTYDEKYDIKPVPLTYFLSSMLNVYYNILNKMKLF